MKKSIVVALLLVVSLIFTACGKEKYEPQAINPDVDVCAVCKMAIKDDQYATQIITKDGQAIKFDDLGDLNVWRKENGTDNIGASYVRDYHSLEWIKYEDAYYVYDSSIQTPMSFGIVSFKKEEEAKTFITEHGAGTLMNAVQLASHSWESSHQHKKKPGQMEGGHEGDPSEGEDAHMDNANEHTEDTKKDGGQ